MEQPPCYEDGTPMPRCQYCGEFFTGYTGNQICADCHDHIVEMETTIAQQRADIEALVTLYKRFEIEGLIDAFGDEFGIDLRERSQWHAAIQPIIERYRDGSMATEEDTMNETQNWTAAAVIAHWLWSTEGINEVPTSTVISDAEELIAALANAGYVVVDRERWERVRDAAEEMEQRITERGWGEQYTRDGDLDALVAYVWQVDRAEDIVGNEAEILRCRAAIEPIIRRWVGGDD
jgi:hypothetical protein